MRYKYLYKYYFVRSAHICCLHNAFTLTGNRQIERQSTSDPRRRFCKARRHEPLKEIVENHSPGTNRNRLPNGFKSIKTTAFIKRFHSTNNLSYHKINKTGINNRSQKSFLRDLFEHRRHKKSSNSKQLIITMAQNTENAAHRTHSTHLICIVPPYFIILTGQDCYATSQYPLNTLDMHSAIIFHHPY